MPDALLVTSSFLPGRGGIESYLAELCERFAPSLAVLAPAERERKAIPPELPYPTFGYDGKMLVPTKKVTEAIVRTAADLGTDRILFGTPWPLVLVGPTLRRRGLRYSVIVHGAELLVPAAIPIVRRRLIDALARADLLLPVSRYTEQKLRAAIEGRGHDVPPTPVLRAAVDIGRFSPAADARAARARLDIPAGRPVVLTFGRLVKRKGTHRLIAALPKIRERVPGTVLVVAGTGPELLPLKRLAHRKKTPVLFAGRVPEDEAPELFAAADVFALPVVDRWFGLEVEGLGVVLVEAAACETPCVTGRSGGTPEAVVDGVTGYVIDGRDRNQLVDRIVTLLQDPDKAAAMGRAGRRHVEAHFAGRQAPGSLIDWFGTGRDARTKRRDE